MTKDPLGVEKIGPNPTDRGTGGVKRSVLTDGHRLPRAVVIAGSHRQGVLLAKTLAHIVIDRPAEPGSWLCLDRGNVGRRIYDHVWQIGMVPCICGRRDERKVKREGARARRWLVERSHSWLNRYRHLLIWWEKRADTYLTMWHCTCVLIV